VTVRTARAVELRVVGAYRVPCALPLLALRHALPGLALFVGFAAAAIAAGLVGAAALLLHSCRTAAATLARSTGRVRTERHALPRVADVTGLATTAIAAGLVVAAALVPRPAGAAAATLAGAAGELGAELLGRNALPLRRTVRQGEAQQLPATAFIFLDRAAGAALTRV